MKNTNNTRSVVSRTQRGGIVAGLMSLMLVATAIGGKAQTYTISTANSSLQVNLAGGLSNWTYDGANQLSQQGFYYSVGTQEYPISSISAASGITFSGTAFGGVVLDTNVTATYANSTLSVTTGYTLEVQGNQSALATAISIQNLSGVSQTLKFYQLSDFTMGGASSGQNVQFLQTTFPFDVTQTGPGPTLSGSLSGTGLGTSVPVDEIAGTSNFGLGNGNSDPNFSGDSPLSATGSVEYAYEFTVTLAAGSGIGFNELQVVPEPSSMALVSAGLVGIVGIGLLRRRGSVFIKK